MKSKKELTVASNRFREVLECGIETIREDVILAKYFVGNFSKVDAIDHLGRANDERAECEREIVEEDVSWALDA